LTGGQASVGATLAGVLLLGLIFNILNFENGLGWISLSAYWQSVIPGIIPDGRRDFPVKARSSPNRHPLKLALADRTRQ
jgi:hypothetical protein